MGDKRLIFSDGRPRLRHVRAAGQLVDRALRPGRAGRAWEGADLALRRDRPRCRLPRGLLPAPPEQLAIYADAGLRFFKLGEQARVDLAAFELAGKARASQRNVLSRGAREGLAVEFVEPAAVPPLLDALKAVSDAWLKERGGGGESLLARRLRPGLRRLAAGRGDADGGRDRRLRDADGGSGREETAIDLMRHVEAIPNVGMEFLFLRICEMLKAEGWHWFDLGMAPLSGFSESEAAPAWHRVGRAIYEQGVFSYNFKGLRGFKSKLQPEWRPRYLAIAGGANPALVLLDATRLIARSARDGREG